MFDPRKIIAALNRHEVEYVAIGGFAATLHGCPEQTFDLDILYADTATNRARQISAGSAPLVDSDRDKPTVIALREIAAGKVGIEMLLKAQS